MLSSHESLPSMLSERTYGSLKEQMFFESKNMLAKIQQKIAGAKFKICSDLKTTAVPITLCVYSSNVLRTIHIVSTSQQKVMTTRQTKELRLLFFIP